MSDRVDLAQNANTAVRISAIRFADAAVVTVTCKRTGKVRGQFTLPEALAQLGALA